MTTPIQTVQPSPDDLACPGLAVDDCEIFGDESEFGVQNADRPRATATKLYADEMGVAFQEVSCRVGWIRFLTRQESWEASAKEVAVDLWFELHEPPLTCVFDGEPGSCRWVNQDGTPAEEPEHLKTVPDRWRPDETDPVWEFCDKATPGAVKCWRLEVAQ